ncbi:MAG: dATP/dGTP diphosphohydrolase domain-containing protein [Candidatus Accumulibacter phosphatis]
MTTDEEHRATTFSELEADPSGKSAHEAGAKLDAGKNRLGLVLCGFARALQAVGAVGTYGANKYTDNGWMKVPDGERRYTDAMLRHLMREATGEERDPDTELHHAAHTAWNALARLELSLRKTT